MNSLMQCNGLFRFFQRFHVDVHDILDPYLGIDPLQVSDLRCS
uniref:Uncharacterized protein n=1 Tax=Anguilla anguilla TaxID=7936 RepID=A0A0E9W4L1_ANGAN